MRTLVCGGRHYTNQARVFQELDARHEDADITLIIEGGSEGADRHARYWALSRGIACITLHACWDKHGKAAGPIRNARMLEFGEPSVCLAFPGGRGTDSMKKLSLASGVPVVSPR